MKYQKMILAKIKKYNINLFIKTLMKNKKQKNYNIMLMKNKNKINILMRNKNKISILMRNKNKISMLMKNNKRNKMKNKFH